MQTHTLTLCIELQCNYKEEDKSFTYRSSARVGSLFHLELNIRSGKRKDERECGRGGREVRGMRRERWMDRGRKRWQVKRGRPGNGEEMGEQVVTATESLIFCLFC